MSKLLTVWSEKYSMGIEELDTQHKMLIEMINDLFTAFTQGKANEVLEHTLLKVIDYTNYHFTTEEKYFDNYNYSDTESHKKQHQEFVDQITQFYNRFKQDDLTVKYSLMNFLRDWLINHILISDKKYSTEFTKNNFI